MNYVDYIVLFLILLVPILVGLFFGYRNKLKLCVGKSDGSDKTELNEYLVASSDMGAVPIAFSLLATFVSTTTLLG
jgi:Na+/pantothenate symporter